MKGILVVVLATMAWLLSSCAAAGPEGVEVGEAWARPAAQGGNGAVYFAIRSSEADELVAVSSDVAGAVEMHESTMSGDVMQMHQLEAVPLDAREHVTFEPGGLHIMLIGLKQDLRAGEAIEITLHFKQHQDISLTVPVQDAPP